MKEDFGAFAKGAMRKEGPSSRGCGTAAIGQGDPPTIPLTTSRAHLAREPMLFLRLRVNALGSPSDALSRCGAGGALKHAARARAPAGRS